MRSRTASDGTQYPADPAVLADPMLRIRYPAAHLLTKKQSPGLFFLTFAALLGFKSRIVLQKPK